MRIFGFDFEQSQNMKYRILLFVISLTICLHLPAQKVGLVLSGGGAKGIAHIGMIKALEEHNIPIDYITGTSMGAIVGGLYAIGYSPEDMMKLIKSDDFLVWMSGKIEDEYLYYFKKNDPTPEFLNIKLNIKKDSTSIDKNYILPTNLINPRQMNIIFTQLFAQASAIADYDFNKLMIPFRCVSSDVYNRLPIVSKSGDLGDAIRASMSFPFVFKPIKLNGILAYDGGIFDNFPVGVMTADFAPDYIIGSQVSAGRVNPDERDIVGQVENMIMDKTNYSVPEEKGILLSFKMENVGLLDFQKADEIYKLGYETTLKLIDSIKQSVSREIPLENVQLRRLLFKNQLPDLSFKHVYLEGVTSKQKEYILTQLMDKDKEEKFTFEEFKKIYFRLLTDSKISEIIPHAKYNPEEKCFDLYLNIKIDESFVMSFGGLISTQNYNEIYVATAYQSLNHFSQIYKFDAQLGKSYNSIRLITRTDMPYFKTPLSINLIAALNSRKFYEGEKFFDSRESTAFMSQRDYYLKLKIGIPSFLNTKTEFGIGIGNQLDRYYQPTNNLENRKFDKSIFNLGATSLRIDRNSLDDKQFATSGSKHLLSGQFIWGKEYFYKNDLSSKNSNSKYNHAFFLIEGLHEKYFKFSKHFIVGSLLNVVVSTQHIMDNYTATIIESPAFTPTPHSKMIFNEAFRAHKYAAAGIKPLWKFNDNLHIRTEFYAFVPYKDLARDENNKAYYNKKLNTVRWMGEANLVFQLPQKISISGYVNYYHDPISSWNAGINIGYLLFTPKLIE